jgi:hypothetical protein
MSTTPPPPPPPTPPTPAVPPAAAAPPVVPAKKSNALLWVLGGCGTIIVLGILVVAGIGFFVANKVDLIKKNPVLAVAKLTVATNPDLETVSNDDSTGTIVVRDKKTGKVVTWKVDSEKKIMTVTDDQGKTVTMKLDSANNRLVVTDDQGKTATITADTDKGNLELKGPEGNTVKIGNNADNAPGWVPVYPGSSPQNTMSVNANGSQSGTYVFVTQDASDKVLSYFADAFKTAGMSASTTSNNTNGKISGLVSGSDQDHKRSVMVTASPETDGTHVSVSFEEKKSAN